MAEVILENVTKKFGTDVIAVNNVNMHVSDGEFLVLLGPSGCGKTTTLRMVAGLEDITSGEIRIGNRAVSHLPPGDRDIAFVFQFYALYPHLSVSDNISFPLRAQKVPHDEVQKRVQQVAKLLKIEHILHRRPGRLPSGEQQRVALGRAIIRQPQVFLMDEPLTNLDASLRADMRVELKHLQSDLGTTMLYVTHDQTEAMSMSHRIAVMNLGILQQLGTPLEIYNHPQTLFVATFIGSPPMNIVPVRAVGAGDIVGRGNQFSFKFDGVLPTSAQSQELVFGVRAENISLHTNEGGDFSGIIIVREPLGDETIYTVKVEDILLTVKTPPRQVYAVGERVGVTIDRRRVHLFNTQTGQAIALESVRQPNVQS